MTVSENASKQSFVWPADYYSSATPAPVLPKWATFGCGAASVFVLIIVFSVGAWLAGGGMKVVMGFVVSMSGTELRGQYVPEVTEAQKKSISNELNTMAAHLRSDELTVMEVQPFLQRLRAISGDGKVTVVEATGLETLLKSINARSAAKAHNKRAA
jgi:hypothetical protein